MSEPAEASASPRRSLLLVALVALRFAAPLLLLHPTWEFHRDEFLYFAMGEHLEPFRMQFPPFIAAIARAGQLAFGDVVWAARVPAALGGAALLAVMLWLVRRLGGGAWPMVAVTIASLASPIYLRASVLMQPVVFDQVWATLAFAALVLAATSRDGRWWWLVGAALGVGALTKFSAAFYAVVIGVTALLHPVLRRQLATRVPWAAAVVALALSLPTVTGQLLHGWPILAQLSSLRATQLEAVSRTTFLVEQPLLLGGAVLLVLAGLVGALRGDTAARVAGSCAVVLLLLLLVLRGKSYYAAPGYPVLMAAGAVWVERSSAGVMAGWRARLNRISVRWLLPAVMTAMAAALAPMGVPLLPPDAMARYSASLGVTAAVRTNRGMVLPLPQDYADMLGWRAMAETAAGVLQSLDERERDGVLLIGSNYGEAGALAMHRQRYGLPYPASTHGDFHAWGVAGRTGDVTVLVDGPGEAEELEQYFEEVREVARHEEPRAVPEEQDVRVYLARRPRQPLDAAWRTLGPRWD